MRALAICLAMVACSSPAARGQSSSAEAEADSWENRGAIATDRPSFTGSALTVYPGHVQAEMGYTLTRSGGSTQHTVGEVNARIGVTGWLEARVGLNSFAWIVASDDNRQGFQDGSLGVRAHFLRSRPGTAIPDLGFTLTAVHPTGSSELGRSNSVQPTGVLAAALGITDWLSVASNLGWGYLDDGTARYSQFSGSLDLVFTLTSVIGAYAELYGLFPEVRGGGDSHFLNGGFTFIISRDVQADVRAGVPLGSSENDFFAGLGFAFRI